MPPLQNPLPNQPLSRLLQMAVLWIALPLAPMPIQLRKRLQAKVATKPARLIKTAHPTSAVNATKAPAAFARLESEAQGKVEWTPAKQDKTARPRCATKAQTESITAQALAQRTQTAAPTCPLAPRSPFSDKFAFGKNPKAPTDSLASAW